MTKFFAPILNNKNREFFSFLRENLFDNNMKDAPVTKGKNLLVLFGYCLSLITLLNLWRML